MLFGCAWQNRPRQPARSFSVKPHFVYVSPFFFFNFRADRSAVEDRWGRGDRVRLFFFFIVYSVQFRVNNNNNDNRVAGGNSCFKKNKTLKLGARVSKFTLYLANEANSIWANRGAQMLFKLNQVMLESWLAVYGVVQSFAGCTARCFHLSGAVRVRFKRFIVCTARLLV